MCIRRRLAGFAGCLPTKEGLEALLDQPIARSVLGAAALIVDGVRHRCALQRLGHD